MTADDQAKVVEGMLEEATGRRMRNAKRAQAEDDEALRQAMDASTLPSRQGSSSTCNTRPSVKEFMVKRVLVNGVPVVPGGITAVSSNHVELAVQMDITNAAAGSAGSNHEGLNVGSTNQGDMRKGANKGPNAPASSTTSTTAMLPAGVHEAEQGHGQGQGQRCVDDGDCPGLAVNEGEGLMVEAALAGVEGSETSGGEPVEEEGQGPTMNEGEGFMADTS